MPLRKRIAQRQTKCMVPTADPRTPLETDLLLPFEMTAVTGDYREYLKTRRNNCFASMQAYRDLWHAFAELDQCWRQGLDDMRRITSADDMLPMSLYIRAHAQVRTSGDLMFSGCMPEAADLLRTGVESAAHAYRIKENPALAEVWLRKDDLAVKRAYGKAFEKEKKTRLFAGIEGLHHYYSLFSEWSHATVTSLALKSEFKESAGDVNFSLQYFETAPKKLRGFITVALDASCQMEGVFFKSFSVRLELDERLFRRRERLHAMLRRALQRAARQNA